MKQSLSLIVTLSVICLISGTLLAFVNNLTRDRIAQALLEEKTDAIMKVLPECDNNPLDDARIIKYGDRNWTFYPAFLKGQFAGVAFETSSSKGFGGEIKIMAGITADNRIQNFIVLSHRETPGLGANIKSDKFKANFINKDIKAVNWKVRKDGGDVDAITAATISSRAMTEAVKAGIDAYLQNRDAITDGGAKQ